MIKKILSMFGFDKAKTTEKRNHRNFTAEVHTFLKNNPKEPYHINEIIEATGIKYSSVAASLGRLRKKGYVIRTDMAGTYIYVGYNLFEDNFIEMSKPQTIETLKPRHRKTRHAQILTDDVKIALNGLSLNQTIEIPIPHNYSNRVAKVGQSINHFGRVRGVKLSYEDMRNGKIRVIRKESVPESPQAVSEISLQSTTTNSRRKISNVAKQDFRNLVNQIIEKDGFKPAYLAEKCGVSEHTIYRWRVGSNMPQNIEEKYRTLSQLHLEYLNKLERQISHQR